MYDMYPWPEPPAADTVKPDPAINAVQVALDRRDNGGARCQQGRHDGKENPDCMPE